MNKPNPPKAKTDNLAWIRALLFPKKSQAAKQKSPATTPHPALSPSQPTPTPTSSAAGANTPPAPPAKVAPPTPKADAPRPFKPLPAFWTVASALSFIVNIILIIVLILLGRELFGIKHLVGDGLLGGLYQNFILMDKAHIVYNIPVQDQVPVNFSLTISQDTVVTLTEPTRISGAQVALTSGGVNINAPANIVLPAGTILPVHLNLTVPVNTTIPIKINVPVDIPLDQTDLHTPFIGLQNVVRPYYWLLQPQIKNAGDIPLCRSFSWFCNWYFH